MRQESLAVEERGKQVVEEGVAKPRGGDLEPRPSRGSCAAFLTATALPRTGTADTKYYYCTQVLIEPRPNVPEKPSVRVKGSASPLLTDQRVL